MFHKLSAGSEVKAEIPGYKEHRWGSYPCGTSYPPSSSRGNWPVDEVAFGAAPTLPPRAWRDKGDSIMAQGSPGLDGLVRQAFGLIIEIRHHRGAARLLSLAVNFLRMMARNPGQDAPPFVFSFTVVPMRENHPDAAPQPGPRQEG